MRKVLQFIIKNPLSVGLVVTILALTGVYSALHMPVDLFPNLEVPVVNIITHYTAASPEDLELLVSRPIEDEMRSIPEVRRVSSVSGQGISQVTVEFNWGATIKDARQAVQAKLSRLAGLLPAGVNPRLESIGTTLQEVVGYIVYGGSDLVTLRTKVKRDLAGRLMGVTGVSSVEVLGGDRRAFIVKVRPETLVAARLSIDGIVTDIRNNNLSTVAGYMDRSSLEYSVRGDARLRTLNDIRSLPVSGTGEKSILLGSVADVSSGRAPRHFVVRGNGVPAVAIIVRKLPGADTIKVVRRVETAMAGLSGLLPPGTQLKKFYDQSEIITKARNEILRDLLMGMLLAVMVLYFFMASLRPTLIVAVTIPISLLGTLAVMGLLGLSLNMITMTALALGIGMIVDDSIVVAENIHRHRLINNDAKEASIEGAVEIAGADASGTFTTVAAFLPLIIVTGLAAIFLKPFGLTISAALIISLVLSLTLVPMLFSRGVRVAHENDSPGARLLSLLSDALQSVLRFCFRRSWLVICLAVFFLGLAGLSAFMGKVSLLPPIDEGAILIEYVMPPGTSLPESNRIGSALDHIALAHPDVSSVYRRTGSPLSGYQVEGVNKGEIVIKLKPRTENRGSVTEIMDAFKEAYSRVGGAVFLYHQPTQEKIDESFSGLPAMFGVTIYGTDLDEMVSIGNKVENIMARDPVVANIVNNTKIKAPQISVRINYPKLALYGVKAKDILDTLQAAQAGVEAARIVKQREDIAILVKLDVKKTPDIMSIKRLPIITDKGNAIPLERVADVEISRVPASITRLNGQREITLLAEVDGSITSLVARLQKQFSSLKLPEGYSIDFSGQYKVVMEAAMEILYVLLSAIVLIYLIMVMQFRSWLQPLIILLTIPISLVGALIALFLNHQGLDISVGMGAVTLVGIAVNNAIVLLDYSNRNMASGKTLQESLLDAASVRLRPILLTALTTIAALLPIAIGPATGSNIFQPFAVTVIGGLISGTLGTLIVVPTVAMLFLRRFALEPVKG